MNSHATTHVGVTVGKWLSSPPFPSLGRLAGDDILDRLIEELTVRRDEQQQAALSAAAALAEFARTDQAPDALRAVRRLVDRGELSWGQVALAAGSDMQRGEVRQLWHAIGLVAEAAEPNIAPNIAPSIPASRSRPEALR